MKISKDANENYIFLETTPDLLSQNFLDTTEDSVFKQFSRWLLDMLMFGKYFIKCNLQSQQRKRSLF